MSHRALVVYKPMAQPSLTIPHYLVGLFIFSILIIVMHSTFQINPKKKDPILPVTTKDVNTLEIGANSPNRLRKSMSGNFVSV
jgi:hypothetical protein